MSDAVKVMVVDDHALFRTGLLTVLNNQPDFIVVGEAGTVEEAVRIAKAKIPDLILMDVGLQDGDGIEAMDRILSDRPGIKVVFLTVHESEEIAFAAIRRGAKGYLTKDIDIQKLLSTLRALERGQLAISRDLSSRFIEEVTRWLGPSTAKKGHEINLTEREIEIVRELGKGSSNQKIAEMLHISANTVKVHVNNIAHKLKFSSRKEVVEFARRQGFVGISRASHISIDRAE